MIINYNNVTNRMREIIANHSIAKKGNYAIIGGYGLQVLDLMVNI